MSIPNISTRQKAHWYLLTWKHSFWQSTVFFRDYFHALFLLLPEGTKKPPNLSSSRKPQRYLHNICMCWGAACSCGVLHQRWAKPNKSHWAELASEESSSFSQYSAITVRLRKTLCIPTNTIKILNVQNCSELIFCLHRAMNSVCPYQEQQGPLVKRVLFESWQPLLVTTRTTFPFGIECKPLTAEHTLELIKSIHCILQNRTMKQAVNVSKVSTKSSTEQQSPFWTKHH